MMVLVLGLILPGPCFSMVEIPDEKLDEITGSMGVDISTIGDAVMTITMDNVAIGDPDGYNSTSHTGSAAFVRVDCMSAAASQGTLTAVFTMPSGADRLTIDADDTDGLIFGMAQLQDTYTFPNSFRWSKGSGTQSNFGAIATTDLVGYLGFENLDFDFTHPTRFGMTGLTYSPFPLMVQMDIITGSLGGEVTLNGITIGENDTTLDSKTVGAGHMRMDMMNNMANARIYMNFNVGAGTSVDMHHDAADGVVFELPTINDTISFYSNYSTSTTTLDPYFTFAMDSGAVCTWGATVTGERLGTLSANNLGIDFLSLPSVIAVRPDGDGTDPDGSITIDLLSGDTQLELSFEGLAWGDDDGIVSSAHTAAHFRIDAASTMEHVITLASGERLNMDQDSTRGLVLDLPAISLNAVSPDLKISMGTGEIPAWGAVSSVYTLGALELDDLSISFNESLTVELRAH